MVEISTPQDVVSVVGQELNVVVVGQEVIETPVYENPLKGKDGRDGVDGKDGRDGIDGVNGRDGIDGRDGRDGRDGKDGLNGINSWIENIDDTLYFRNDGGLPEPKPVKLKEQIKAWGFGVGRGGGQLPADWNQKNKNNPTFIKNKPDIAGMISTAVHNHDVDLESHADIRADIDVLDKKIDAKQDSITSSNKLSADLITNGTTNKVVTQTEKNTWNSKLSSITSSMVTNALGFTPYNSTNPARYLTIDTLPKYDGSSE